MSNLNISIDMGRVQSSVQASIRPAVEEALTAYDVKAAIIKQLTEEPPKKGERDHWSMPFLMFRGYAESTGNIGSLLDQMVREGIADLAKQYVHSQIAEQRADIEEAFRKMMAGSTNRLVKAFAAATEAALKEDWGFELDVKVKHTVAEKDRYDD